jgi:hypothetical protein
MIDERLRDEVKALAARILLDEKEHPQIRARAVELLHDCGDFDDESKRIVEAATAQPA